ncbi:MAG: AlwI family type II restriction endonuclease [Deltaproteobacteria bacterium]|nr:AlwI family type II restriction endonuclease [Deltaproteobacteria bacterium]
MPPRKSWPMRTKPRSAIRTVQWLPAFIKVEGKDWDRKEGIDNRGEPIHPVRREYLRYAHPYEDYSQTTDPESNARQEKAIYEYFGFGYVNQSGLVVVTPAGREIVSSEHPEELMLRQLLKWQFPSAACNHNSLAFRHMRMHPFKILLEVMKKFDYVTRYEVDLTFFTCLRDDEILQALEQITYFRERCESAGKNQAQLYKEIFQELHPDIQRPSPKSFGDMGDALFRFFEYTGLFTTSGRAGFTTLRVPARAITKVRLLQDKFTFEFHDDYPDQVAYFEHYGNPYSIRLPWETTESLRELVSHKVRVLCARLEELRISGVELQFDLTPEEAKRKLEACTTLAEIKILDELLFEQLVSLNERDFVYHSSKTAKVRAEILDKFDEILAGDADEAALWLEVNTWKSLVALNGEHYVKRNFKVEEDLSPRAFAPGVGNTPDMELYNEEFVIIPEVSLQSGVSQWITEGSAVTDHVYKFIEVKNGNRTSNDTLVVANDHRPIVGFFLCHHLNERTGWQFFVLNRDSWRGQPVPIVPLNLKLYRKLIGCYYSLEVPATQFERLLYEIHKYAHQVNHFQKWLEGIPKLIECHLRTLCVD